MPPFAGARQPDVHEHAACCVPALHLYRPDTVNGAPQPAHTCTHPRQLQILSGIISATDVPFSSYVAHPRTPLHYVDARLKQLWLLALLLLIPRLPWQARVSVVAGVLLLSVVCLPRRLCKAQLKRLLPLALLLTGITALTADQVRFRRVRPYACVLAGLPAWDVRVERQNVDQSRARHLAV